MGFMATLRHGLAGLQDHFELHKTTETIDSIQVNPRSPNKEHLTLLCDDATNHENAAQGLHKRPRIVAGNPCVDRFFRSFLIAAFVRNHLTRAVGERADLEPTPGNHEEGVCLIDDLGRT